MRQIPFIWELIHDCTYYIHRVIRITSLSESLLHNQNPNWSRSELVEILECEEFYRGLREKELTEKDKAGIQEFISHTLSPNEWDDFLKVCLENELNPYEEIREIIYSTYAKILRNAVK